MGRGPKQRRRAARRAPSALGYTVIGGVGYIAGTEYLASIELGTEIEQGAGDVLVKSFKATLD